MLPSTPPAYISIPPLPDISGELSESLELIIHNKTKPRGSLGMLEALACKVGAIQGSTKPSLESVIAIVFAGDHGIAQAGVSAFPQEVTRQMVATFLSGNAAVNVLCRANNTDLLVVDCGIAGDEITPSDSTLHNESVRFVGKRAGSGTNSFVTQDALTKEQLEFCWQSGAEIALDCIKRGYTGVAFGEMGIANTSSAAVLTHFLTGIPLSDCVGRGTGLNDTMLAHKRSVLQSAVEATTIGTLEDLILRFAGFEIVTMASTMLHLAAHRGIVIVDGFIATSAFLIARALQPSLERFSIFSHCSNEHAHASVLKHLGVTPVLSLGMRLGEASGAVLCVPMVRSAVAILNEMASFSAAEVSEESAL
jgi:nicotinate-nucleotide--dimethylbenzimidazole phosphoribosyltransferase